MVIENGDVVKLNYILKDKDGNTIGSSEESNRGPIKIHVGTGQILSGFEKQIIGMEKGEQKEFVLTPEETYGEFDPLLVEKIPKKKLKGDIELKLGEQIEVVGPHGMSSPGWIRFVEDDFIIVDMNPPLAGKTLHFKVEIVETDLVPDPVPSPFQFGMSCESCNHDHKDQIELEE